MAEAMTDKEHRAFVRRLKADLDREAESLTPENARYLVDIYYQQQEDRKRAANQARAAGDDDEPHFLVAWLAAEFKALENLVKHVMDVYTNQFVVTRWAKSLFGVGPVLTAGIFAHIDINRAPTAGSLWRLSGYDPTVIWTGSAETEKILKNILRERRKKDKIGNKSAISEEEIAAVAAFFGRNVKTLIKDATTSKTGKPRQLNVENLVKATARRPWNSRLKTLLWKFADVQKKFSGNEKCFYGRLYKEYKTNLKMRNENGDFAEAAAEVLKKKPSHKQKAAYAEGKLPDGHLDARAMRWVSKLFLSHLHTVYYEATFNEPAPKPYVIAHLNHVHMIEVPNWPMT